MAPDPSGNASASARADAEPIVIAPERRDVRQEKMRDEHRLRGPEMREGRHQRVAGRPRLAGQRGNHAFDSALQQRNAAPEIEPQVDRHLLVPRAAGMQTPAGVAQPLHEQTLDEAMHIFVGAVDETGLGPAAFQNGGQRGLDAVRLVRVSTRRRDASARAHARLPMTSSSKRRRSKPNDEPHSNAAASGGTSKRPDQRCVLKGAESEPFRLLAGPLLRDARPARARLQPRVGLEPLHERRRAAIVARDDENRVVAGDRADRLRQLRAVDGERQRLRLPGSGANDDELLHAIDAPQEARRRALERVERELRTGHVDALPLIGAVAGALDEPELLDVARDRRLRGFAAALQQPSPHLLLAVERLAIDQFQDQVLTAGFHRGRLGAARGRTPSIHKVCIRRTRAMHRFLLIAIEPSVYKYPFRCIQLPRQAVRSPRRAPLDSGAGRGRRRDRLHRPGAAAAARPAPRRAADARDVVGRSLVRDGGCRRSATSGTERSRRSIRTRSSARPTSSSWRCPTRRQRSSAPGSSSDGVRVIDLSGAFRLRDAGGAIAVVSGNARRAGGHRLRADGVRARRRPKRATSSPTPGAIRRPRCWRSSRWSMRACCCRAQT